MPDQDILPILSCGTAHQDLPRNSTPFIPYIYCSKRGKAVRILPAHPT